MSQVGQQFFWEPPKSFQVTEREDSQETGLIKLYMRTVCTSEDRCAVLWKCFSDPAGLSSADVSQNDLPWNDEHFIRAARGLMTRVLEKGVVISDVPFESFFRHLHSEDEEFLSKETVEGWKREAYGRNPYPIPLHRGTRGDSKAMLRVRQYVVERNVWQRALQEIQESVERLEGQGAVASVPSFVQVWKPWIHQMANLVEEKRHTNAQPGSLSLVSSETLAVITAKCVLQCLFSPARKRQFDSMTTSKIRTGPSTALVTQVASRIGSAVNEEWRNLSLEALEEEADPSTPPSVSQGPSYMRERRNELRKKAQRFLEEPGWSDEERVTLGAWLLETLVETATVDLSREEAVLHAEEIIGSSDGRGAGPISLDGGDEMDGLEEMKMETEGQASESVTSFLERPDVRAEGVEKLLTEWRRQGSDGNVVFRVKAFVHLLERFRQKSYGCVQMRECVRRRLEGDESASKHVFLELKHQPMLSPSRRWTGPKKGGFLRNRESVVKWVGPRRLFSDMKTLEELPRVYEVLSKLGSVPWKINTGVLAVVQDAWERDLRIAKLPPRHVPEPPLKQFPSYAPGDDKEERKRQWHNHRIERLEYEKLASVVPTQALKIVCAQNFKDAEEIFFPHNVDFRGRAYPLVPHLHHEADDLCRGLLKFARKKRLGESGLRWLKIHLANLFGKDKLTLEGREEWVDGQVERFRRIVSDPLRSDVIPLWEEAEDPWQALAVSQELVKALDSGDPENFESDITVHQDGSCNGLQHYAALGRDPEGALAVNVIPSDDGEVQDVYLKVLEMVKRRVELHASGRDSQGVAGRVSEETQTLAAQIVEAQVLTRKTVKQTVMTICYGVTFLGAKDQIKKQIVALVGTDSNFPIHKGSIYLAKQVLGSVDEIFKHAMEFKKWFDKISKLCTANGLAVEWVTPFGFPVQQPYRKARTVQLRTNLQKINLSRISDRDPPSSFKQRLGMPPNFIHSLDATHMMMTAEKCFEEGLDFAAVHDSYWTHAADVDKMGFHIRDQFVELYDSKTHNILSDLRESFEVRLGSLGQTVPELPQRGDLDLHRVRESKYFFD
uniref:DNA-directed RNA polymerase n=1 Tax=Chromera velia CCMP2878 TaxID=1169474 RepID=A0A0G4GGW8_9ALVE|eukprot:Cvel_4687.t1-p1 / transcript=Cvel_4687.t1 / gene=Cvel_4687 / organism=Chromera_velia_CCMP2878 / gene_product=DNA-directed RNA polymerase 2,, putative / transcript_product=DNA-directed RNA polymerase 2,, putative / location=Cvel_scaffold208:18473-28878(+) / protein_length=1065 / sequence_SO=supercontig / SO=protein_coding / is_pseudo=false